MSRLPTFADSAIRRQAEWTIRWHEKPATQESDLPWTMVEQNHRMNFDLWHEEDVARRDDLGPERVRQAKRNIDRFNQSRNDSIEQLDSWFLAQVQMRSDCPQHSETPGMMVDRLSILALKIYHMRLEAARETATEEHRRKCAGKAGVLEEQLRDLAKCLQELLDQLEAGARRFKIYRQFKMYNDASLNPQLYKK